MRPAHILLVFLVVSVIAISGCITVTTGNGVVIEEFSTGGLDEVYPGEPITFLLKVRNLGSVQADGVFSELLGLDEDWARSSQGLGTIAGSEMLPQETRCQYTGEGFTLMPPDPTYGTEGESGTCTWKYKAPDISQGMNPEYPITARIFYRYRTDLVKSFTVLSTDELIKYNQQGQSLPSSTVSSTSSPISITARARDPIRFWDDGSVSFPLAITVSNVGGGTACLTGQCKKSTSGTADQGGAEWDKIKLFIKTVSSELDVSSECQDFKSGREIDVWPNRDNTITCNIEVSGADSITGFKEMVLGISAEYSYFIDTKTVITIL